jgi:hypothetical protein
VELSSPPCPTTLPGPAQPAPAAGAGGWARLGPGPPAAQPPRSPARPPEPAALACRPIGRLQREEVVILLYELCDRGTGTVRGYQSVVLSNGAAAHA